MRAAPLTLRAPNAFREEPGQDIEDFGVQTGRRKATAMAEGLEMTRILRVGAALVSLEPGSPMMTQTTMARELKCPGGSP